MINIIGITGKVGSGKSTIGKMIQYLTYNKEVIPKEFSLNLKLDIFGQHINHGCKWQIKSFAHKIKQIASIITGFPIEKFEDRKFKESFLGDEWNLPENNCPLSYIEAFKNVQFTRIISVREFLQKIGTECMRNNLHPNTWINALWVDYKKEIFEYDVTTRSAYIRRKEKYPRWCITDVRFKNEAQSIRDRNGIIIKLTKNLDSKDKHQSEKEIEEIKEDYIIDNKNKTIEETLKDVKKLLIKLKIIQNGNNKSTIRLST